MLYLIPFYDIKILTILGHRFFTWEVFWYMARIVFIIVSIAEFRRLKLRLDWVSLLVFFGLNFFFVSFFEHLLYFVSHAIIRPDPASPLSFFNWNLLGRVYFGTIIGSILATATAAVLLKETKNILKYFDVLAVVLPSSSFFYRIGNFLTSEHIGKITNVPWAIEYMGQARHDISLYELLNLALVFAVAWPLRKKIKLPGFLSLIVLSMMSLIRFFTDFLRNDDLPTASYHFKNGFTLNQIAYSALFFISFAVLLYLWKKYRKNILDF